MLKCKWFCMSRVLDFHNIKYQIKYQNIKYKIKYSSNVLPFYNLFMN